MLSAGGDFFLLGANDHVGHVNARKLLKTDDGALIYDHVRGLLDVLNTTGNAVSQTQQEGGKELLFYAHHTFKTGDSRYRWLNNVVAVSRGHQQFWQGGETVHEVYALGD